MNKLTLLEKLGSSRETFLDTIDSLPVDKLSIPGVVGEWSIKDILAHICFWEAELVKMLWQLQHHQKPTSIHFQKNSNVDQANSNFFEMAKFRPLERVVDDFHSVRNQTILNVENFSERELTEPNHFRWLNNKPLMQYISNDSFEHEEEHLLDINNWIQSNPELSKYSPGDKNAN